MPGIAGNQQKPGEKYLVTKLMEFEGIGSFLKKVASSRGQGGGIEGPWARPLSRATRIATNCRTIIDNKDWNLPKMIFYIQRHKEETRRDGRRGALTL